MWLLSFNVIAIANVILTLMFMLAAPRNCEGRPCEYDMDAGIVWMLIQFLVVPLWLITLVAVLLVPRRRRLKSAWPGYTALAAYALFIVAVALNSSW